MPNIPTVRPARQDDKAALRDFLDLLARDLSDDSVLFRAADLDPVLDELLDGGRGCILIAEDSTGPLGMVTVSFNLTLRHGGEYAQVEELIVGYAARGKHVGAALMEAAVEAAHDRGCAEIGLYAVPRNRPFYEKFGFEYVGPEMRRSLV